MAYTDDNHELESSDDQLSEAPAPLILQLRGRGFPIKREVLMNLPESILLCLFPNGLVLRGQASGHGSNALSEEGAGENAGQQDEVIHVDFDPECLQFVLSFFQRSAEDFYGPSGSAQLNTSSNADQVNSNPLATKQAIIVLREELDFYGFPPKESKLDESAGIPADVFTNADGQPTERLLSLKRACGEALLKRKAIFAALGKSKESEDGDSPPTNIAEQHLIDMLCASGFSRNSGWSHRAMEPQRACITSIALVLLRKAGNPAQLQTAQKLLLFWRKPARKCWWDSSTVEIVELRHPQKDAVTSENVFYRADPREVISEKVDEQPLEGTVPSGFDLNWKSNAPGTSQDVQQSEISRSFKVKTWARRVWTLELSLI